MNTFEAAGRAAMARVIDPTGARARVFDWEKAARIIRDTRPLVVCAGLARDWEWTGGCIYRDGKPEIDDYTFLLSIWATPEINVDGHTEECWRLAHECPGWNATTKWPSSALDILEGRAQ